MSALTRLLAEWTIFALLLALILGSAPIDKPLAAELLPPDVIGKWAGTAPNSRGEVDRYEICVKDEGVFLGDVQSARGSYIKYTGHYALAAERIKFDGKFTTGGQYLLGQTFVWTLELDGDTLHGPGNMTVRDSKPFTIVFKRAVAKEC